MIVKSLYYKEYIGVIKEYFHNTIYRIKHWKSNEYERFFLVLNDWAGGKEKWYSSLPKLCHGNASKENAK